MRRRLPLLLAVLIAGAAFAVPLAKKTFTRGTAAVAPVPTSAPAAAVLSGAKVTFLELGSVGCRPCDAMRPVMDAVRQKYGTEVEVVFHDVRENPAVAQQYRIFLIPTQVFLDSAGREVFRHEGFLALDKVETVLRQLGVGEVGT
jgi:thioredoxin 1